MRSGSGMNWGERARFFYGHYLFCRPSSHAGRHECEQGHSSEKYRRYHSTTSRQDRPSYRHTLRYWRGCDDVRLGCRLNRSKQHMRCTGSCRLWAMRTRDARAIFTRDLEGCRYVPASLDNGPSASACGSSRPASTVGSWVVRTIIASSCQIGRAHV